MTRELLTPDLFMRESFRHSQGSEHAQINIIRYFEAMWDIKPNFHPSPEILARYDTYLTVPGNKQHIQQLGAIAADTFDSLEQQYYIMLRVHPVRSPDEICHDIAQKLVSQESRLLDWWNNPNTGKAKTPEGVNRHNQLMNRMSTRIQSGKSSYLLLHGRDGESTNSTQFDQMYQDVWPCVEDPAKLEGKVRNAEIAVLGRTVLAPEIPQVPLK